MSPRKAKASADPVTEATPFLPLAPSNFAASLPSVPKEPSVPVSPDDGDFVIGSKWDQVRQTGAYEGTCWIYSPARVEFLAEASDALVTLTGMLGLETEEITKLEVILQRSTKRLFFRPAGEKATSYFDVVDTSNDYFSVNIRSLLQPYGLEVKTGYQQRYHVSLQADSPVGPALMVDLTKVEERKQTAISKARKAAKASKAQGGEAEASLATSTKTKASPAPAKTKTGAKKATALTPESSAEPVKKEAPKEELAQLDPDGEA
jgi:hypothetical protein